MKRLGFSALLVGLTCSAAFADTFYLTVPENNCATSNAPCIPANSVLVTVLSPTTSTATVTFTAENVGGVQYALREVLFEVNGSFGISSIVVTGGNHAGTTNNPAVNPGPIDEAGNFSEMSPMVTNATSIAFNLTGGSWASAANVLTTTPLPNNNPGKYPYAFEAVALVRVANCTSSTQPGCSGNTGTYGDSSDIAGSALAPVPEPTSIILLGSAALLIGGALRKKLA